MPSQNTASSSSSIPRKAFRCGIQTFQRRYQQRLYQQKRKIQRLSHRERLNRVSRHNFLGNLSIVAGSLLFVAIVVVILAQVSSWKNSKVMVDVKSVALLSWGLGMGLGCSFVMVFAESSRHFRWATQIQTIDEELQEIDTITTQEDADLMKFDDLDDDLDRDDNDDEDVTKDGYNSNGEDQVWSMVVHSRWQLLYRNSRSFISLFLWQNRHVRIISNRFDSNWLQSNLSIETAYSNTNVPRSIVVVTIVFYQRQKRQE